MLALAIFKLILEVTRKLAKQKLNSFQTGKVTATYVFGIPTENFPGPRTGNARRVFRPYPAHADPNVEIALDSAFYSFGSPVTGYVRISYPDGSPAPDRTAFLFMWAYEPWNPTNFTLRTNADGRASFAITPFAQPPGARYGSDPGAEALVSFGAEFDGDGP